MSVVGADKIHFVALHPLKADPRVGLNVFHDVSNMEGTVGIGKGSGDKKAAGHEERFRLKGE